MNIIIKNINCYRRLIADCFLNTKLKSDKKATTIITIIIIIIIMITISSSVNERDISKDQLKRQC